MSWLLPNRQLVAELKRAARLPHADRHRPGYWRDYHARNIKTRRPYLTAKARQYRSAA